ncbi:hypothetical protein D3C78_838580 [compost metagenome]
MRTKLHGVGTWLDDRDQRCIGDALAQAVQRGGDGGRVVSEVVIDGDATDFRDFLHPAFNAFEGAQRSNAHGRHHTDMACGGKGCQGVGDVVLASHVPLDHSLGNTVEHHFELRAIFTEQFDLPLTAGTGSLHRGPATHFNDSLQRRFSGRMNHQAFARDGPHQVMELALDGWQVREDVRVIELKVVQDCRARAVMYELGALVEERTVVFVGFDDEEGCITQACRHREVLRYAADQEARGHACMLQHPGQHAAGGGLAVRTGNRQYPATLQHMIGQPLRAGDVGQAFVQHVLHSRVAPGHGVADHYQIRGRIELRRIVALGQFNALGLQLSAHRRIDVGIGAGHVMAQLFGQNRHRAHESPADTQNMNVH